MPEGLLFTFEGQRFKINSIHKARDFMAKYGRKLRKNGEAKDGDKIGEE